MTALPPGSGNLLSAPIHSSDCGKTAPSGCYPSSYPGDSGFGLSGSATASDDTSCWYNGYPDRCGTSLPLVDHATPTPSEALLPSTLSPVRTTLPSPPVFGRTGQVQRQDKPTASPSRCRSHHRTRPDWALSPRTAGQADSGFQHAHCLRVCIDGPGPGNWL